MHTLNVRNSKKPFRTRAMSKKRVVFGEEYSVRG